jgi:osmotically-inducible protein OsmY
MKTDSEIQKDVLEEIKWESSIKNSDIGLAVTNGIVTLTGSVDSYVKKKLAKEAALRVLGVKAVAEDIIVKLSNTKIKTDTEVAQAVVNALKWHSSIQEDRLKVTVENSWVTVEGDVDWAYEREAVEDVIENLIGVRGVSNLIIVKTKVMAHDVKSKIMAAFHRNATIDANNISVETVGSRVVLTGTVRSFAEKKDAEVAAGNAPGVVNIYNQLEVKIPELVL